MWLSILLGIHFQSLYTEIRARSRLLLLQQLLMVAGVAFLLQAIVSAVYPDLQIPLRVMLLGSLLSLAGILAGRLLFGAWVLPRIAGERWLPIGDSPLLDEIAGHLGRTPQAGIQLAGRFAELAAPEAASLEDRIRELRPNRIVVGLASGPNWRLAQELLELRFSGHAIEDAAEIYEKICNRVGLSGLNAARLLYAKEFEPGTRWSYTNTGFLILGAPTAYRAEVARRWCDCRRVGRCSSAVGGKAATDRSSCTASALPPGPSPAACSPAPVSTLCRNSSTSCAGRCRSWDRGRHGRNSRANSSGSSRSTRTA